MFAKPTEIISFYHIKFLNFYQEYTFLIFQSMNVWGRSRKKRMKKPVWEGIVYSTNMESVDIEKTM